VDVSRWNIAYLLLLPDVGFLTALRIQRAPLVRIELAFPLYGCILRIRPGQAPTRGQILRHLLLGLPHGHVGVRPLKVLVGGHQVVRMISVVTPLQRVGGFPLLLG
jgi:hypothetical protein